MRAEVGLLSHNVIFRGSTDRTSTETINACPQGFNPGEFAVQTCFLGRYGEEMGSDEFGASIMASASQDNIDGSQRVILRLSNIEVLIVDFQWEDKACFHLFLDHKLLVKHFVSVDIPFHFHMNGNMSQSYIKSSSIHQTFNRAVKYSCIASHPH